MQTLTRVNGYVVALTVGSPIDGGRAFTLELYNSNGHIPAANVTIHVSGNDKEAVGTMALMLAQTEKWIEDRERTKEMLAGIRELFEAENKPPRSSKWAAIKRWVGL